MTDNASKEVEFRALAYCPIAMQHFAHCDADWLELDRNFSTAMFASVHSSFVTHLSLHLCLYNRCWGSVMSSVNPLFGRSVLIVEDEPLIALELHNELRLTGASTMRPPSRRQASVRSTRATRLASFLKTTGRAAATSRTNREGLSSVNKVSVGESASGEGRSRRTSGGTGWQATSTKLASASGSGRRT